MFMHIGNNNAVRTWISHRNDGGKEKWFSFLSHWAKTSHFLTRDWVILNYTYIIIFDFPQLKLLMNSNDWVKNEFTVNGICRYIFSDISTYNTRLGNRSWLIKLLEVFLRPSYIVYTRWRSAAYFSRPLRDFWKLKSGRSMFQKNLLRR